MSVGVDEAGRGALAGPVVAAAVWLDAECPIDGLNDSKRLTAARRERLAGDIRSRAVAWAVAEVDARAIDALNILQASLQAMRDAVAQALSGRARPPLVLVDGNRLPEWHWPSRAVVGGDGIEACIMAASILAKVHRDQLMQQQDAIYPGYGFAGHKGYPTRTHVQALARLGPSAIHRRSFAPVARLVSPLPAGEGPGVRAARSAEDPA